MANYLKLPHHLAMARQNQWIQILKAVATPLSFFVLTLLIVESTLCLVLIKGSFSSEEKKWAGFLWMAGIFVGVVGFVAAMTILNPKHLLYGKEEHSNPQLDQSALRDQIEDLIVAKVKPESLKSSSEKLA
jgi:hypothetical protein